jgi:hypothetical protein
MFTIIGDDHAQYGPETAEQIRQWIKDGRANAQTMTHVEGSSEWKPLASLPEFADLFPAATESVSATPSEIIARDYEVRIGSCLKRSWELLNQNFWPVVGISFLVLVTMIILEQVVGLISHSSTQEMARTHHFDPAGLLLAVITLFLDAMIQSVFLGGFYNYLLKLVRGQKPGTGDAFAGFSNLFGPLAVLGLIRFALVFLGTLACIIPGIYLSIAWYFAIPLMIDKRLNFREAMKLSLKTVGPHWFEIFALAIVIPLVGIVGVIGCGIGIFVTIPFAYLAYMFAYEDIFGDRST